jgi:hypothetical protein
MVLVNHSRVCNPLLESEKGERCADIQGSEKDLGRLGCGIIKSYHTPDQRK